MTHQSFNAEKGSDLQAAKYLYRPILCGAGLLYMYSLLYAYENYLYIVWEYFGFSYARWGGVEHGCAIALVGFGALLLPVGLVSATSNVLILLYLVAYVPGIVVTLSVKDGAIADYGAMLIALCVGFSLACLSVGRVSRRFAFGWGVRWDRVVFSFYCFWGFSVVALYFAYGGIMTFSGFDDIYTQRLLSRAESNPLVAYIQSTFVNFVCAFFMAAGLVCKKKIWFLLGVVGCVFVYSISAGKTVIATPLVFLIVNAILKREKIFSVWALCLLFFFSFIIFLSVENFETSDSMFVVSTLLVFRTLAIPGLTFSQYYDVFSRDGFTWWSHVKGVSFFVAPPPAFAHDPAWPGLGLVVGERIYGNADINVNANLWSGDGVAAAGVLGVLFISVLLALYLRFLERACLGWNSRFVILCLLPFSLSITNVGLFTCLLSFGGIVWAVFFGAIKIRPDWPKTLGVPR